MRLSKLTAQRYRSLRNVEIEMNGLNLFIGANASGKSAILDTLRFLSEAVSARDFRGPVISRGGMLNLAWKGERADSVELRAEFDDGEDSLVWDVLVTKADYDFTVSETVQRLSANSPPQQLLVSEDGEGWWWSGEEGRQVKLKQPLSACALAAASVDSSFPARAIADFVVGWGFFDPSPFLLRRDRGNYESGRLDPYGRNLAETLYGLEKSSPKTFARIRAATESILGLPTSIEPRESEDRFYFVQFEPGLKYSVNQMGVSSGTLRTLALMTALYGKRDASLVGIEEPENYIHPTALQSFVECALDSGNDAQLVITTHSPLLLDFLDDPSAVRVVRRDERDGTTVQQVGDPDRIREALEESGFGLGEFYQTTGFGA